MGLEQDFARILDETIAELGDNDDLLPTRLAVAAARVLPVDGASISVSHNGYRVPLGASDEASAVAERLQFTTGAGPCMTAIDTGAAVSASEGELRDRWPELAELWREQTGFRSAASHPLIEFGHINAALNLFFLAPDGNAGLDPADLAAVAGCAKERMSDALGPDLVIAPGTSAERRRQVWVAVGMGMGRWHLEAQDALDRLRAHAYGNGTTLDELANRLVNDIGVLDELD